MAAMVLVLNAVLYAVALSFSLAVLTPVPAGASRRTRATRVLLACGGGIATTAAIVLTFVGLWLPAAVTGVAAVAIIATCMWFALTRTGAGGDEEDDADGGGGQRRPPDPLEPVGGPSPDLWSEFDRARAGWERAPIGV